jgi:hypothetical protein
MKHLLAALSLMLAAAGLSAITAKVVDTEGPATARLAAGTMAKVAIGKAYTTGDSIRTGKGGMVELSQSGLTIRVGPSTVFTLLEKELDGKPKGVVAVTLGTVKMKYDRLTGSEPLIQSASCIAGVRGTEVTVWAGTDGASQLIVDSGLVTVEAFGKTVELGPDEAVVVVNGQQPGEKFVVQRGLIDHAKWEQGRVEALLADPLAAIDGMRERLAYYSEVARDFRDDYTAYKARLDSEIQQSKQMRSGKSPEEVKAYEREHVVPLLTPTQNLYINARYHLLAAAAMRRFVGGRIYLLLKIQHLAAPDDAEWKRFVERYAVFLEEYESAIAPFLVDPQDF